eukprot:Em0001g229a
MRAYNEPAWVPDVILSAGTCTDGGELAETGRHTPYTYIRASLNDYHGAFPFFLASIQHAEHKDTLPYGRKLLGLFEERRDEDHSGLRVYQSAKASRKTRGELSRNVDADYYGYRDEDDGVIVPLEQEVEKKAIAAAVKHWEELHAQGKAVSVREDEDIYTSAKGLDMGSGSETEEEGDGEEEKAESLTNHLEVPSQKEIEEMLVRRKKMELLEKYATEALVHQEEEAKALLGYTS